MYLTLVDDQQIDCIVRTERNGQPAYTDLQTKFRSREAQQKSWGEWPSVKCLRPRSNCVFLFFSEPLKKLWIVPSRLVADKGYRPPSRITEPVYKVTLATPVVAGRGKPQFGRYARVRWLH